MSSFLGLCGFGRPSPCKIAWASSFRPSKIGLYPSDYLPAKLTIWYASSFFVGSFNPPVISPGDFGIGGIGGGILGGLVATGAFSFQTDIWTTPSWYSFIWAKTTTHVNMEYTIKAEDLTADNLIISGDSTRQIKIKMNDYVFDVLCIVDDPDTVQPVFDQLKCKYVGCNNIDPTADDDVQWDQSSEDRFTRDLFTLDLQGITNRYIRIYPNRLGLEYRLDNTREYAARISNFRQSDLLSPSYNDASSKEIVINLAPTYTDPAAGNEREVRAGDKIYITYLGIPPGGHIMRQHVFVKWTGFATSLPPEAGCMVPGIEVAHYRFFTWDLEKDDPANTAEAKKQVSGWRVVETFNYKTNHINIVYPTSTPVIADFARGNETGHVQLKVVDGNITYAKLNQLIDGQIEERSIYGDFNKSYDGSQYHINASKSDVAGANWIHGYDPDFAYHDQIEHLVYNIHPKALRRRDIDKWGIPRFMSDAVQKDISAGKVTFVPFMDDPYNLDPLNNVGHNSTDKYLDSSNFLTNPIQRTSAYGGNAECASGSMGGIGSGNWGADNYAASLLFTSNIITEYMPKETKILIEQFFTQGSRGDNILSISAQLGSSVIRGVSCILDPSRSFIFVFFPRNDWLAFDKIETGLLRDALSVLDFHPEAKIKVDADNPKISSYEPRVGYGGLLGDYPGYARGNLVNFSLYGDKDTFEFYSSNPERSIFKNESVQPTQVPITFVDDGSDKRIEITLPDKYYGYTYIQYDLEDTGYEDELLLVFKKSDSITNVVDNVHIRSGIKRTIKIHHPWVEADHLEISGKRIKLFNNTVVDFKTLVDERAKDFLDNRESDPKLSESGDEHLTTSPVLFSTPMMSVAEDTRSNLYVFFQDKRDGVSVALSRDFGDTWSYQYGVVEKMGDNKVLYPFILNHHNEDKAHLFFSMRNKIFCKPINLAFEPDDELRVVSFDSDVISTSNDKKTEQDDWYTSSGRDLRGHGLCYLAAGSIFDEDYVKMMAKEFRVVEEKDDSGIVVSKTSEVKIRPLSVGTNTCFFYADADDPFFSAYRIDKGDMLLFFMGKIANGRNRLQCHFSTDEGRDWMDLWEYMTHSMDRVKADKSKPNLFIDREDAYSNSVDGNGPTETEKSFAYGINLHKQGKSKDEDEIDIQSPYVYHQPSTGTVYLFYIYQNSLFCKKFQDELFTESYEYSKEQIEGSKSYFVDGWLKDTDLLQELDRTFIFQWSTAVATPSTNPDMQTTDDDGQPFSAIANFDEGRAIDPHRITACEIPSGLVKVFYMNKNGMLRSAIFKNPYWIIEDMLYSPLTTGFYVNDSGTFV